MRSPHHHGRQGAGLVLFQLLAQSAAQGLLEPGRPGPKAFPLPQHLKLTLIAGQKHHLVGVPAGAGLRGRGCQGENTLDLIPRRAHRQVVAPAAQLDFFPADGLHPNPGPDGGMAVALPDILDAAGQADQGAVIALGPLLQPGLGPGCKGHPQHRARQQAGPVAPGRSAQNPHTQADDNKESRKRPKGHLRLKSSDQLRTQRTGKECADRPPHLITSLVEEQGQRLQEDDILPLGCVALGQNGGLAHNLTVGLLRQGIQCLEGAAGGDDIIHHQGPACRSSRPALCGR